MEGTIYPKRILKINIATAFVAGYDTKNFQWNFNSE